MDIISDYQNRVTAAQQETDKYRKLINTYSFTRLGVFVLLIISVAVSIDQGSYLPMVLSLFVLGGVFVWLISRQAEFEKRRAYYQNLQMVNQNEIDSINQHTNIYPDGAAYSSEKHYYTSDLDIFGQALL